MGFVVFILICLAVVVLVVYVIHKTSNERVNIILANREANSGLMDKYEDLYYREYIHSYKKETEEFLGSNAKKVLVDDSKNVYVARKNNGTILVYEDKAPQPPYFDAKGIPQKPTKGSQSVIHSFPVNDVLYWAEKGSLQYTTASTGNGTQVLTNALKGAAIAGTAGAVIGGLGTLGAQSQTVTQDTRRIVVKMKNAAEQEFPYYYQKAFIACMPEKEYEFLKMSNKLN